VSWARPGRAMVRLDSGHDVAAVKEKKGFNFSTFIHRQCYLYTGSNSKFSDSISCTFPSS
jgi:hypothetical protein